MSWEGYYQNLCKSGHYYISEDYGYVPEDNSCPICKESVKWWNTVDITNGSFEWNPDSSKQERIDGYVELEVEVPAKICRCSCCGNEHKIQEETYKIPAYAGHLVT